MRILRKIGFIATGFLLCVPGLTNAEPPDDQTALTCSRETTTIPIASVGAGGMTGMPVTTVERISREQAKVLIDEKSAMFLNEAIVLPRLSGNRYMKVVVMCTGYLRIHRQ